MLTLPAAAGLAVLAGPILSVLFERGAFSAADAAATAPALAAYAVAMAYVDADRAVPGSALAVDIRGTITPVDVVELPFYRRSS